MVSREARGRLEITSLRVRYTVTTTGAARVSSIMLDEVASCVVQYTSYTILLIIGAVAGIAAYHSFTQLKESTSILMFFGAVLSVGGYFVSRRHVVRIGSAAASIDVPISGMSTDEVIGIIDAIEEAKAALSQPK